MAKPRAIIGMTFFILFISLFCVVGFGLLGFSSLSAWRSMQAARWPTTPGAIAELSLHTDSDGDGTTYQVKVQYTYTVNGVIHAGSRLAYGYTGSSDREAHEEIHRKLENAQAVLVRYDPSNPDESCLSYGLHRSLQAGFAFSITWLAFVFGFTLLWWLSSRADGVLLNNLSVQP